MQLTKYFLYFCGNNIVYLHFCMKRYIKYLGIAAIIIGILLFVLHVVLNYHGNALLFSGLTLVLGGIVLFVKGEGTTAIQPSKEDKDKK